MIRSKRIELTEWAPDQPTFGSPVVHQAINCVPRSPGYGPFPSLVDLPDSDPAEEYIRGAISALKADGDALNFAGDRAKLYLWEPNQPVRNVSGTSAPYNLGTQNTWRMVQFNELVFAQTDNIGVPLQYYDMTTHSGSSTFADVTPAPRGAVMDVVGPHLMIGRTTASPNEVHWAAANDPLDWPTDPDEQIAKQSGRRTLPGKGGWVQAVVGGAEIGAVFQERMVWRADYVGGEIQYDFNKVEPTYGLKIPHLAIPLGRTILFYSEAGWRMFDYTGSVPIGKDRIDRWFASELNEEYSHRVSWAIDSDSPRVLIAFPSIRSQFPGNPDTILIYDWALDRFSTAAIDVELVTRFRPIVPALLDGPYYVENSTDGTLDGYSGQMDEKVGDFGSETLGAFRTDHSPASFSGSPLNATINVTEVELTPGRWSTTTEVRPYEVEGANVVIGVLTKGSRAEAAKLRGLRTPGADGACKIIASGRYHTFSYGLLAGGFDDALGMEVLFKPSGRY